MADLPMLDSKFPITSEVRGSFARDGHVLVRGLASEAEIAAYRPHIAAAAKRHNVETRPIEERDTYGKAFLQVWNLWREDDAVRRFTLAKRFARVAAELLNVDGVRLYHDQALFKEPGGGATPMHQDQHYWPIDTDRTVTMWMPLVPVPAEVGSMTFASGSHRLGYLGDSGISEAAGAALDRLVAALGLSLRSYGAMSPGDATFHAGWTLHGAPPNPTPLLREVMTIIYVDASARVTEPAEHQSGDLEMWMPGLRPGDPVASELNPLVWAR